MTEIIYGKYIFWFFCKFTTANINNRTWPKNIYTIYYFSHRVFIYSVNWFWSYVPALNFPKNQKLDPNSKNFLLVGSSPSIAILSLFGKIRRAQWLLPVGSKDYPVWRLAAFSMASCPAKAQKSALETGCPSFWYFSSRSGTMSSRPLLAAWFRLMQPLQPPTQLWKAS